MEESIYSQKDFLLGLDIQAIRREAEMDRTADNSSESLNKTMKGTTVAVSQTEKSCDSPKVDAHFRCPEDIWKLAQFCAKADDTTISTVISNYLREYIKSHKGMILSLLSTTIGE